MRITVEIDGKSLDKVMQYTGNKKKSTAISKAIDEYLRMRRVDEVVNKVREGKVSYGRTNDELEAMVEYDDIPH